MMASPSELSLERKTQSYSMLLKPFGVHNSPHDQAAQKLEEYLNRLEEERLKVDAFKRELPLCMQLLANAMETSRQQLQNYKEKQGTKPVLEEFISLQNSSDIEESQQKPANISDKANWMTSAQLWSQTSDGKPQQTASTLPKTEVDHIDYNNVNSIKLCLETKQRKGAAFLPFSKEWSSNLKTPTNSTPLTNSDIASGEEENQTNDSEHAINGSMSTDNSSKGGNGVEYGKLATDSQITIVPNTNTTNNQNHRKARRCWSPDLHRRFVNALQMLGGPQVATPKQIRELMKVDGLTNDEVKSHLQKYRLHTRRPSSSSQVPGTPTQQIVVLGSIWVPPEYATATTSGTTMYTASQMSPHYCSTIVPQDYYSVPPQPTTSQPQLHHPGLQYSPNHNQQLHVYKTSSHTQTHSLPESDTQGDGNWSDSIEDGKYESSNWKAESDGKGGLERKTLVAMRDCDRKVSNENEITLNF